MKDGPGRRVLKAVALVLFRVDLGVSRAIARARGSPPPYRLAGDCRLCAACCEAPAIRANALAWHLPPLRSAFLAWQRRVNGFELVEARQGTFVFRCTHFDHATRRCDSYASRPGICRDYPRALLDQPRPEFLPGCGYRPVARNGPAMIADMRARGIPDATIAKISDQLHLR